MNAQYIKKLSAELKLLAFYSTFLAIYFLEFKDEKII
jgi:hypothetical protein